MKILINGLPYFSERLAKDLNGLKSGHSFRFIDTYNSRIAKLKFALQIPYSDGMISMNGVTDQSGSLDLAIRNRKKIWMQWQGTDVLLALKRAKEGTINRKYIEHSNHFTDAPWLAEELKSIGIDAEIIQYKWLPQIEATSKFQQLAAFSYLAQNREEFYGWESIKNLAIKLPDVPFYIVGSNGNNLIDIPKNVIFKGWVDHQEMKKYQREIPIFIRLTEHDGFSLSVLEAFAFGAEVIWTQPHELVHHISSNLFEVAFENAHQKILENEFKPNLNNINYIKDNFQKLDVLNKLIKKMENVFG